VPRGDDEVDLNQVVAYNFRAARELRGWTQEDVADRLAPYMGQRPSQAAVSAIERAWESERRREFDAQELLVFSLVFDVPIVWFLLPPPGDRRLMRSTTRPMSELYAYLLGMPHQLEPLYARLRELGIANPDATDEVFTLLTGGKTPAHHWGYRERRRELLLALLDQHADAFDTAVEDLGRTVDRLRQIGIRGFLAETTNDRELVRPQRRAAASTTKGSRPRRSATDPTDSQRSERAKSPRPATKQRPR
jgi:transcriptional regulator with XRE-family HTH domain